MPSTVLSAAVIGNLPQTGSVAGQGCAAGGMYADFKSWSGLAAGAVLLFRHYGTLPFRNHALNVV